MNYLLNSAKYLLCGLLFWGFASLNLSAQNIQDLTGQIIDSLTQEPISAAVILVYTDHTQNVKNVIRSDSDGRFQIPDYSRIVQLLVGAPAGTDYQARVFKPDEFSSGKLMVCLLPRTTSKEEKTEDFFQTKDGKFIYSASKDASLVGKTIVDALRNIPGIEINDDKILFRAMIPILLINETSNFLINYDSADLLNKQPSSILESIEVAENQVEKSVILNIVLKKEENIRLN